MAKSLNHRQRVGFTLIELLVVVLVLGILFGLIAPAVQSAREGSRRLQCINNLKQIGLALQEYESLHNMFPGVDLETRAIRGKSTYLSTYYFSPIVHMLPHLEQVQLYNGTNFLLPPVEGAPLNQTAMRVSLNVILCPSDIQPSIMGYGRANYRFNLGPTAFWANSGNYPLSRAGPFTVHVVYSPADFRDGLSMTVGISERLEGDWTRGPFKEGGDYVYTATATPPNIAAPLADADRALEYCAGLPRSLPQDSRGGESWFLSGLHFTNYNHCATPNMHIPDCCLNRNNLSSLRARINEEGVFKASSYHTGGVNAAMMDGSVRFFGNSVALQVWRAVSTRSGGEVVEF